MTVKKYIAQELKKGRKKSEIKAELVSRGFGEEDLKPFFKSKIKRGVSVLLIAVTIYFIFGAMTYPAFGFITNGKDYTGFASVHYVLDMFYTKAESDLLYSNQTELAEAYYNKTMMDLKINDVNWTYSDTIDSWKDASTQTIYVDCSRTDDYTEDGNIFTPYKSIKSAYASITDADSNHRYSVLVQSDVCQEDNPIPIKHYVFTQGDFKHNPRIEPLNEDEPLFQYQLNDASWNYSTCDWGELTFQCPEQSACFDAPIGTKPITGLYYNLFIGTGENSTAFTNREDVSGYHLVNCMAYGTYDDFANLTGGNWLDFGMQLHAGTVLDSYVDASGEGSIDVNDLNVKGGTMDSLFRFNNENLKARLNNIVSDPTDYAPEKYFLKQTAGTTTLSNPTFRGGISIDGGDFTMSGGDGYVNDVVPIFLSTTGDVEISTTKLIGNGTFDDWDWGDVIQGTIIIYDSKPTTFSLVNNNIKMEGESDSEPINSVYSFVEDTNIKMIGNYFERGVSGNVYDSTTKTRVVPDVYYRPEDALSASREDDIVFLKSNTYQVDNLPLPDYSITLECEGTTTTFLNASEDVFNFTNVDSDKITIKKCTVEADKGNRVFALNGQWDFDSCSIIDNGVGAGRAYMTAPLSATNPQNILGSFTDTYVSVRSQFDDNPSTVNKFTYTGKDCQVVEEIYVNNTNSQLIVQDCSMDVGWIVVDGNVRTTIRDISMFSEEYNGIWSSTSNILWLFDNDIGSIEDTSALVIADTPSGVRLTGNSFSGGSGGDINVLSGVTADAGDYFLNNVMPNGVTGDGVLTHNGKIKKVGDMTDSYIDPDHAIEASSDGDLVEISSGTYTTTTELKSGVNVKGTNRDTTILQYPQNVLTYESGYSSSRVSDLTLKTTTEGNSLSSITEGTVTFDNVLFQDGYLNGDSRTAHARMNFEECEFDWEGESIIDSTDTIDAYDIKYFIYGGTMDSEITIDSARPNLYIDGLDITYGDILFNVTSSGTHWRQFVMANSKIFTESDNLVTLDGDINSLVFSGNRLSAYEPISCIKLLSNPGLKSITNNVLDCPGNPDGVWGDPDFDIEVPEGVTVDNIDFSGNVMSVGIGGGGIFSHNSPNKYVGGITDYYNQPQNAIRSSVAGDTVFIANGIWNGFNTSEGINVKGASRNGTRINVTTIPLIHESDDTYVKTMTIFTESATDPIVSSDKADTRGDVYYWEDVTFESTSDEDNAMSFTNSYGTHNFENCELGGWDELAMTLDGLGTGKRPSVTLEKSTWTGNIIHKGWKLKLIDSSDWVDISSGGGIFVDTYGNNDNEQLYIENSQLYGSLWSLTGGIDSAIVINNLGSLFLLNSDFMVATDDTPAVVYLNNSVSGKQAQIIENQFFCEECQAPIDLGGASGESIGFAWVSAERNNIWGPSSIGINRTIWNLTTGDIWSTDEPSECNTYGAGVTYYDTDINEMCICNTTTWTQVDGGGDCN